MEGVTEIRAASVRAPAISLAELLHYLRSSVPSAPLEPLSISFLGAQRTSPQSLRAAFEWQCLTCTFINRPGIVSCEACGADAAVQSRLQDSLGSLDLELDDLTRLGSIRADGCINAESLSLSSPAQSVLPGRPAVFRLSVQTQNSFLRRSEDEFVTLIARLQVLARLSGSVDELPVRFALSPSTECVDIVVELPEGTPIGSFVEVYRVAVVGDSDVALLHVPTISRVGYVHVDTTEGPVLAAATANDVAALMQALQDGGSTEERASDGWHRTPLHVAADMGHVAVAQALIRAGAVVNARDGADATPLHYAAFNGYAPIVEALVAAGAHVGAKDSEGRTPMKYARHRGHDALVAVLSVRL